MSPIFILLLIVAVASSQFPDCGPNATWSGTQCTDVCKKTCTNYQLNPPPKCLKLCSKGCSCKTNSGYVIDDNGAGNCVLTKDCTQ